jgi:hypothetical protein
LEREKPTKVCSLKSFLLIVGMKAECIQCRKSSAD